MKRKFKPNPMLSPVPAVMVTLGQKEKANIITIGWTGIINSNPPMTYISVRKERHSHRILTEEKEFVINLTTEYLVKETDYCGVKSGRNVDKFAETGLGKTYGEFVACPMIEESPVNLECKVKDIIEFPTHDMFIAEIINVHVDEAFIDETGKICLDKAKLISYIHGEYFAHKNSPLGRFGYSIMKAKTKKRISKENHEKRVEINKKKRQKSNYKKVKKKT